MITRTGEVNCSVHGTHGLLDNGQCWYCSKSGMKAPIPTAKKKITSTVGNPRVTKSFPRAPGVKRKIV